MKYKIKHIAAYFALMITCLFSIELSYPFFSLFTTDLEQLELNLPDNYQHVLISDQLPSARHLSNGPDNWIIVGSRSEHVYALEIINQQAVQTLTLLSQLNAPNSTAYNEKTDELLIAEIHRVIKITNLKAVLAQQQPPQIQVIIEGLPTSSHHGYRVIKIDPSNKWLYLSLGTPCNICIPPDQELTGVIRRYLLSELTQPRQADEHGEIVARGIRNSVGFDFSPQGELWFSDNGVDFLGDYLPLEEINRVQDKTHFGYPYCHQGNLPDKQFGSNQDCATYAQAAYLLDAHSAPLGIRFSPENSEHNHPIGLYVARHGSWNRSSKIGYDIYFLQLNDKQQVIHAEPFINGWLQNQSVLGRPVDIIFTNNNDILVSDDSSDALHLFTKVN